MYNLVAVYNCKYFAVIQHSFSVRRLIQPCQPRPNVHFLSILCFCFIFYISYIELIFISDDVLMLYFCLFDILCNLFGIFYGPVRSGAVNSHTRHGDIL